MSHAPWFPALLGHLSDEPTTTDELVEALEDEFPDVEPDEVDAALRQFADAYEIYDQLWVDLGALADGIVLTHILGAEEIATGWLNAEVDLDIIAELARTGLPLAGGGGVVETSYEDDGIVLKGPDGWLSGYEDGTLISVHLREGELEVTACRDELAEQPDAQELVELLQTEASDALDRFIDFRHKFKTAQPWVPLVPAVVDILTEHPELLRRPTAPIAVSLLLAGVDYRDGMIAMAGAPRSAEDVEHLSDKQVMASVRASVILVGSELSPEDFEEDVPSFFAAVEDQAVTDLIAARYAVTPLGDASLDVLARVAQQPSERALVALLRGRSAEAEGESLAAERHIADALRDNPRLRPALEDAGLYAADRGDLSTAEDHLKRAEIPSDHTLRSVMKRLGSVPATQVGRNQPCPCRSGRKYKVCHLREEVHPLRARVPLVYARLLTFADLHAPDELPPGVKSPDPMLVLDLAIFEGGLAEEYLRRRGPLLREDERAMVERWLSSRPLPYEVSDAKPGSWITLQPLLGGDPVTLHDRLMSQSGRPGDLVVARVVDDGDGPAVASNPHGVAPARRQELIDLFKEFTPEALLRFFDQAPTLPVLQNRDGHDLVQCEATFEVPAAGATAAWRRLAASLTDQDGPDTLLWGRDLGDETLHLGTVRRDGRLWTLETNSRERMEELESFVFEAAPKARLVSSSATPAHEAALSAPDEPEEPPTPEMLAYVRQYIEQYERKWVDEQIPALDGLTPRQALAKGGLARRRLDELLDGMERMESEQAMSAKRVRKLLGLTEPTSQRRK